MNRATTAITDLYRLAGDAFAQRFAILTTNLKRQLLEEFIKAPSFIHSGVEELLNTLSASIIHTQETACHGAEITDEQKQGFENRLDNALAEAIIVIRDSFSTFGNRALPAFQLETAKKLGIPLV